MRRRECWRMNAFSLGLASLTMLSTFPALAQRKQDVKDLPSFVRWVNATHKAPFDREGAVLPPGGHELLKAKLAGKPHRDIAATLPTFHNVRVNQDRNPWPKAGVGAAVDPSNAKNYVVMANDFRENNARLFFHVSTNGGKGWTDDALAGALFSSTDSTSGTFQSDPGVSFDRVGHSYLSGLSGNSIFDFNTGYVNMDTEIEEVPGEADGTYADLSSTSIDDQICNGAFFGGAFTCDAILDKPLITTDTSRTSTDGTTYVYYTFFCLNIIGCSDGTATRIPSASSVILESHSAAAGLPFTPPALVSGRFKNAQFSDMVIDSEGIPHIFFDDFTDPSIRMWESSYNGSAWVVAAHPVASFSYTGLNNRNWGFRDNNTVAPGCGVLNETAYCAFSATQIAGGQAEATPSVYVTRVDLDSASSTITRVNNDPFRNGKHHFFPWATVTAKGIYVGWYDDRNDPFNATVQYWVGKSTDSGKTFSRQVAVSDTAFNPCTGFPNCGFFGDYTQLVSGPDGVVHAAWTDTRDQASQQIWSQSITW